MQLKGGRNMPIKYYKLLDMMNKRGISKGELQRLAGFSSATMAKLSANKPVMITVIGNVCRALSCQPGDILEYVDEDPETEK